MIFSKLTSPAFQQSTVWSHGKVGSCEEPDKMNCVWLSPLHLRTWKVPLLLFLDTFFIYVNTNPAFKNSLCSNLQGEKRVIYSHLRDPSCRCACQETVIYLNKLQWVWIFFFHSSTSAVHFSSQHPVIFLSLSPHPSNTFSPTSSWLTAGCCRGSHLSDWGRRI